LKLVADDFNQLPEQILVFDAHAGRHSHAGERRESAFFFRGTITDIGIERATLAE